jgi:hypothetical protein
MFFMELAKIYPPLFFPVKHFIVNMTGQIKTNCLEIAWTNKYVTETCQL